MVGVEMCHLMDMMKNVGDAMVRGTLNMIRDMFMYVLPRGRFQDEDDEEDEEEDEE